jgi:lipopolysaccharide heptosyltransferase II
MVFLNLKKAVKKFIFFLLAGLRPFSDTNKPIDNRRITKILVFESGGIGDLLRVFPVIETLHDNFPDALLSVVVSPASAGLLELFPKREIIFDIFFFDAHSIHKSFFKKMSFLLLLRKKHFDLIYAASRGAGMRELEIMVFIIGAPNRIGFSKDNIGAFHTVRADFDYSLPILRQNLSLLERCGLNVTEHEIKLQIPEKDKIYAHRVLGDNDKPVISIDPTATWMARYAMWPFENYIMLVRETAKNFNCTIILLGDKKSRRYNDAICKESNIKSVINMSGKTTISQAAALIQQSNLFIGNDSGLLHIADALSIPSIGIFGPTSPEQVLTSGKNSIVIKKNIPCSPCYVHQHDFEAKCQVRTCLKEIKVSDVMDAIDKILKISK